MATVGGNDLRGIEALRPLGRPPSGPQVRGAAPIRGITTPAAVFEPDPQRVRGEAFLLLAGVLSLFATDHRQRMFEFATTRLKKTPAGGYQMDFLAGRPCDCRAPQLVVRIGGVEYLVECSSESEHGVTLYRARCVACSRQYEQPWRRTRVGSASVTHKSLLT